MSQRNSLHWSSIQEQKRCFVNEKFVWWNLKSTLIKQKKLTLVEEWLCSLLQVKLFIISKWVAPNKTARSQTGYVKDFLTCEPTHKHQNYIKIIWTGNKTTHNETLRHNVAVGCNIVATVKMEGHRFPEYNVCLLIS